VRRHLDALASDEGALAAYRVLSAVALQLAREVGTDQARLDRILALLGEGGDGVATRGEPT
jgi:hypothetical protein